LATATILALRRGHPFPVRSPESIKDFVHVEDVGSALAALVEAPVGHVLDVGMGVPCSVREFVSAIARILGLVPDLAFQWGTATDPTDTGVADTAALRALGWRPRLTLEAGLRDLLEHVKDWTRRP
jgi:nucleoside-diphosphate-sugar epimerase